MAGAGGAGGQKQWAVRKARRLGGGRGTYDTAAATLAFEG